MVNLFSRLGFNISKPEIVREVEPKIEAQLARAEKDRKALGVRENEQLSERIAEIVPLPLLQELMKHNDYLCVQWGSRKVGRMVNACRSILDHEIHTEGSKIKPENERSVTKLLVLMCILTPVPIKHYMLRESVEEEFRLLFSNWLDADGVNVNADEKKFVIDAVFSGIKCPENPILNIFHDALRIEEAHFGFNVKSEYLRTSLCQNLVYLKYAQKSSANNVTPGWLEKYQELMSVDNFVDVSKAKEDDTYNKGDIIS
jgi:hypothetical protein